MSADQVQLAGMVIAIFCAVVCIAQFVTDEAIHWLWLLLLLAGIVCWVVA